MVSPEPYAILAVTHEFHQPFLEGLSQLFYRPLCLHIIRKKPFALMTSCFIRSLERRLYHVEASALSDDLIVDIPQGRKIEVDKQLYTAEIVGRFPFGYFQIEARLYVSLPCITPLRRK